MSLKKYKLPRLAEKHEAPSEVKPIEAKVKKIKKIPGAVIKKLK